MENNGAIRCRVAACYEPEPLLGDGKVWSFYLINDSELPLDVAKLYLIEYEWGGMVNEEEADVRVTDLTPGANALIWRDDGSGAELRMGLSLIVRVGDREVRFRFQFPKTLYKKRNLPVVDGLGKAGWEGAAEE